jgi:hypothetical protein
MERGPLRAGLVAALLATSSGCAWLVHRDKQLLGIESDPPGAVATLDGERCVTPCELPAPRSRDAVVALSKEEREPAAVEFRSRLEGTTLLNLLLPVPIGPAGIVVDLATGSTWELVPPTALVALPPARPTAEGERVRAPSAPTPLAPLAPVRWSLGLSLGGATNRAASEGLLQLGVAGSVVVSAPFVVGATVDAASNLDVWGELVNASSALASAGAACTPTRNSRLTALLQAGAHRYGVSDQESAHAVLPAVGVRVEWSAIFGDRLALGAYGAYLRDLGRRTLAEPYDFSVEVGGDTVAVGISVGLVGR